MSAVAFSAATAPERILSAAAIRAPRGARRNVHDRAPAKSVRAGALCLLWCLPLPQLFHHRHAAAAGAVVAQIAGLLLIVGPPTCTGDSPG